MWWCTGVAICNLVKVALFSCLHIHINKHPHTQKHTWSPDTHMRMLRHTHTDAQIDRMLKSRILHKLVGGKKNQLSSFHLLSPSLLFSPFLLCLLPRAHLHSSPQLFSLHCCLATDRNSITRRRQNHRKNLQSEPSGRCALKEAALHSVTSLLLFWYLIHYHPLYYV